MGSPNFLYVADCKQVEQAVNQILSDRKMESLLKVEIVQREHETYHKMGRGRPTSDSKYRREVTNRFELRWHQAKPEGKRREGSIDVYLEGRRIRRPTARFVLDALEELRRYEITTEGQTEDEPLMLQDELSPMQARLLTLLGADPATYGQ